MGFIGVFLLSGAFLGAFLGILFLSIAIPYFCGCFNGAVIVSKYILHDDIRNHGSGNAGLTNFYRTFGGKLTAVVLLLDVMKMIVAVWIITALSVAYLVPTLAEVFSRIGDYDIQRWMDFFVPFSKCWAGLWCLLGHMFPITFGFKGGKGVLSGVTLMFCLDWRMGLIAMAIFFAVVLLTRYISLGSCLASLSFPLGTWLFVSHDPLILTLSVLMVALVVFMHRGNLGRVFRGEERKFSLHRKKD